VFNVASGRSVRIGALLESMLAEARTAIEVKVDSSRFRQAATPKVVGDAARLRAEIGWRPQIPLEDTLTRILAERRLAVAAD
jgi:GDP-4-dehydro-6-deoxy-D-mannose reductase